MARRLKISSRPLLGGPLSGRTIPTPVQATLEILLHGQSGYYLALDRRWGTSIPLTWVPTR